MLVETLSFLMVLLLNDLVDDECEFSLKTKTIYISHYRILKFVRMYERLMFDIQFVVIHYEHM